MKRVEKDILFILISSFILTVIWIGFNIHHKWVTTTISRDLQTQIIPISPNFDLATLEKLKTREKIVPILDTSPQPSVSPTPFVIPTPTTEVVPTAEPTPTLGPEPTFGLEPPIVDDTGEAP